MTLQQAQQEYEKARDEEESTYYLLDSMRNPRRAYKKGSDFGREYTLRQMEGEMKEHAVKFAEWCDDNNWVRVQKNLWRHSYFFEQCETDKTDDELYNLFTQPPITDKSI